VCKGDGVEGGGGVVSDGMGEGCLGGVGGGWIHAAFLYLQARPARVLLPCPPRDSALGTISALILPLGQAGVSVRQGSLDWNIAL